MDSFPRWTTLNDIPQDTIDIFVESHIYGGDSNNHPNGALLYIEMSNPICLEANVIPGSQNPYKMLDESSILFAINPTNGYLGILTTQNFRFSTSSGIPDLIVEDAIAYKIDHHLTPF